jgi:collagenase-like PrtC family protease
MIAQGMQRWSVPIEVITPELKSLRETLTPLISSSCVPFELTVSGHPPLGYSARCFTARHHQRNREECKQICLQNAPLVISSLEHEPLFRINGTQLTSAHALACPSFLSSIVHPDTDLLRIIPHSLVPADLMTQLADVQSNLQSSL